MSDQNTIQDDLSNEINDLYKCNKTNIYETPEISESSKIEDVLIESDKSFFEETQREEKYRVLTKFQESAGTSTLVIIPKIIFHKEVKNKMYRDTSFLKYISEIEYGLFGFSEKYQLQIDAQIYFQRNWEFKEIKETILKVKFYELSFDDKLKYWKKLSKFIQMNLNEAKIEISSKEELKDLEFFNELFYIHIELR